MVYLRSICWLCLPLACVAEPGHLPLHTTWSPCPALGLALLVQHHLIHLVHLGLALLAKNSTTGPGRHRVIDSVVLVGLLAVELLVTLLPVEDGALPPLLGVAPVVGHGCAEPVQQVLALLPMECLLQLSLDERDHKFRAPRAGR